MIEGHKVDVLAAELQELGASDGPLHYSAAQQAADLFFAHTFDAQSVPNRSLGMSFAGTYDGTDWHDLLAGDCTWTKASNAATQTGLTLIPTLFKKAIADYSSALVDAAISRREQ